LLTGGHTGCVGNPTLHLSWRQTQLAASHLMLPVGLILLQIRLPCDPGSSPEPARSMIVAPVPDDRIRLRRHKSPDRDVPCGPHDPDKGHADRQRLLDV